MPLGLPTPSPIKPPVKSPALRLCLAITRKLGPYYSIIHNHIPRSDLGVKRGRDTISKNPRTGDGIANNFDLIMNVSDNPEENMEVLL
jgi:hypothetical protein